MTPLTLLTLLSVLSIAHGKGANHWCVHYNKYLRTYSSGVYRYSQLHIARQECVKRHDCFGITRETNGKYTLRKDWQLKDTTKDMMTLVPCGGYFSCQKFGLKTAIGTFLRIDSKGTVTGDRSNYGHGEKLEFKQWGVDSGFLMSNYGKYLTATDDGKLKANTTQKGSSEMFILYQDHDRIAIESNHGKHISAKSDGEVLADVGMKSDTEWFEVHPQSCLNNIECECPDQIDGNLYFLSKVDFDSSNGTVKTYRPERVGYQYIDNEDSSMAQYTTFTVAEQVEEKEIFTHTGGVAVKVGTEFKCGVPVLAQSKVSVEVTASYEFSYGKETTNTKTMQADYNCVAAPGKIVTCQAYLFKYKMSVPYTQTWQHKRVSSCTCQNSGIFTEVAASEMRLIVDED